MYRIPRRHRLSFMRVVCAFYNSDARDTSVLTLESGDFNALRKRCDLVPVMENLSHMGLIAFRPISATNARVMLTSSGKTFFERSADARASVWSDRRFSLLQAVIGAALAFLAGLAIEYRFAWLAALKRLLEL